MTNLLSDIASRGWLVSNLFQLDDLSWRANLRRPGLDGDWYCDFGNGSTIFEALEAAYQKLDTAEFHEHMKPREAIAEPTFSISDLIAGMVPALKLRRL